MKLRLAFLLPVLPLAVLIMPAAGPALCAEDTAAEVLYWVAPMDPAYRRDKPGKSLGFSRKLLSDEKSHLFCGADHIFV